MSSAEIVQLVVKAIQANTSLTDQAMLAALDSKIFLRASPPGRSESLGTWRASGIEETSPAF